MTLDSATGIGTRQKELKHVAVDGHNPAMLRFGSKPILVQKALSLSRAVDGLTPGKVVYNGGFLGFWTTPQASRLKRRRVP